MQFGIISDIQYADIPDGRSFHGVPRYYRNSLVGLQRAVDGWQRHGQLDFSIHFGDIIDGFHPKGKGEDALSVLLAEFERTGKPHYHMIGNHCLYNLERPVLNERLGLGIGCESGVSYYSAQPHPRVRIIFADGYDVSVLGWPEGHPNREAAEQLLSEKNPNENKNNPPGLEGPDRRFVQFGGGASQRQLDWIKEQVEEAAAQNQRVIVCCHLAFCPGSCPNACLLWNYEDMLKVLRDTAPGTVVATMAGHTHQNGYLLDEHGIHHLVLPAVLETPPGRDCYGHVDVWEDRIEIQGVDTMMSLHLPFLDSKSMMDVRHHIECQLQVERANLQRIPADFVSGAVA